jgi:hypothetical protein
LGLGFGQPAESRQSNFPGNHGSCLFDPHQQNFGVDVMALAISAARDVQRRFYFPVRLDIPKDVRKALRARNCNFARIHGIQVRLYEPRR